MHLESKSAICSAVRVQIDDAWYILILLRLPFGGSSCPPDFCLMSDVMCDVTNDLLACEEWNEDQVYSNLSDFVPPDEEMNDDIFFAQAKEMGGRVATRWGRCRKSWDEAHTHETLEICKDTGWHRA